MEQCLACDNKGIYVHLASELVSATQLHVTMIEASKLNGPTPKLQQPTSLETATISETREENSLRKPLSWGRCMAKPALPHPLAHQGENHNVKSSLRPKEAPRGCHHSYLKDLQLTLTQLSSLRPHQNQSTRRKDSCKRLCLSRARCLMCLLLR